MARLTAAQSFVLDALRGEFGSAWGKPVVLEYAEDSNRAHLTNMPGYALSPCPVLGSTVRALLRAGLLAEQRRDRRWVWYVIGEAGR